MTIRKVRMGAAESRVSAPKAITAGKHWTTATLILAIKERGKKDISLLRPAVMKADRTPRGGSSVLYGCKNPKNFGSYRKGVEAAGFNYAEILATQAHIPIRYANFTPEQLAVIEDIQARHKVGLEIDLASVINDNKDLAHKGLSNFERKWRYVVEAAGISYDKMGILGKWPVKALIDEMQFRIRTGKSIKQIDVFNEDFEYVIAANKRLGLWSNLIEAATKAEGESKDDELTDGQKEELIRKYINSGEDEN